MILIGFCYTKPNKQILNFFLSLTHDISKQVSKNPSGNTDLTTSAACVCVAMLHLCCIDMQVTRFHLSQRMFLKFRLHQKCVKHCRRRFVRTFVAVSDFFGSIKQNSWTRMATCCQNIRAVVDKSFGIDPRQIDYKVLSRMAM